MSFWQFLFNACWREVGTITRSLQLIFIPIPLAIAAVVGLFGGEWSRDYWPWWVWLFLATLVAVLVPAISLARRAFELEKAIEPRLRLTFSPTDVRCLTRYDELNFGAQILVENLTQFAIEECQVELAELHFNGKQHRWWTTGLNIAWSKFGDSQIVDPSKYSAIQIPPGTPTAARFLDISLLPVSSESDAHAVAVAEVYGESSTFFLAVEKSHRAVIAHRMSGEYRFKFRAWATKAAPVFIEVVFIWDASNAKFQFKQSN